MLLFEFLHFLDISYQREITRQKIVFILNSVCFINKKLIFNLSFQSAAGLDLKDNLAGGPWPYPPVYPGYDAALAGYHFNG